MARAYTHCKCACVHGRACPVHRDIPICTGLHALALTHKITLDEHEKPALSARRRRPLALTLPRGVRALPTKRKRQFEQGREGKRRALAWGRGHSPGRVGGRYEEVDGHPVTHVQAVLHHPGAEGRRHAAGRDGSGPPVQPPPPEPRSPRLCGFQTGLSAHRGLHRDARGSHPGTSSPSFPLHFSFRHWASPQISHDEKTLWLAKQYKRCQTMCPPKNPPESGVVVSRPGSGARRPGFESQPQLGWVKGLRPRPSPLPSPGSAPSAVTGEAAGEAHQATARAE